MSGSCEFPPFAWKPRRGKPVTVVAVLRSADSFLMAADSLSTDMNNKFLTAKLEHLEERPICWGVAGDSALAQEFGEWLAEYRWDSASWPDLKTAGETRIAALNGKWRKLQKASGKKPDPMDVTSALVAGYLDGKGRILKLTDRSPGEFIEPQSFTAVGSGEFHALVASRTLSEVFNHKGTTLPRTRGILTFIVQMAILTDPNCGGPIQGMEVSSDKVTVWNTSEQSRGEEME